MEPQEWAASNVAVTVFKDEEAYCSYPSNFQSVAPSLIKLIKQTVSVYIQQRDDYKLF